MFFHLSATVNREIPTKSCTGTGRNDDYIFCQEGQERQKMKEQEGRKTPKEGRPIRTG